MGGERVGWVAGGEGGREQGGGGTPTGKTRFLMLENARFRSRRALNALTA